MTAFLKRLKENQGKADSIGKTGWRKSFSSETGAIFREYCVFQEIATHLWYINYSEAPK